MAIPKMTRRRPAFDDWAKNVAAFRTQSHADADFMGSSRGGVGEDAVDADGDENQADRSENGPEQESEARAAIGMFADERLERAAIGKGHA
jgi:hypothetical protein